MSKLAATLQQLYRQRPWWPAGSTVIVAVSGGPDSLTLLHVLGQLAPGHGWRLVVAHLDHQLRPDSADDAAFVAATAAAWGWPCAVARADVAAQALARREGLEAAARAARYDWFAALAQQHGAAAVALGHTADDQAETVLLRLLRGAGPTGLAAMRPRLVRDDGLVVARPLLAVRRSAVAAYCADHGLAPRLDPSNLAPQFVRNRVRAELLPLLVTYNPAAVAALGRTAQRCAEEDDCLTALLDAAWPGLAEVSPGRVTLGRAALAALHPALQRRALRRAVALLGDLTELGADHLDRMLALVAAGRGRLQLPAGCWITLGRDAVIIYRGGADGPSDGPGH